MNCKPEQQLSFLATMKTSSNNFLMTSLKRFFQSIVSRNLALALTCSAPLALSAADIGQTFATPEEAVAALAGELLSAARNTGWQEASGEIVAYPASPEDVSRDILTFDAEGMTRSSFISVKTTAAAIKKIVPAMKAMTARRPGTCLMSRSTPSAGRNE